MAALAGSRSGNTPLLELQTPQGATEHYSVQETAGEPVTGETTVVVLAGKWLDIRTYAAY